MSALNSTESSVSLATETAEFLQLHRDTSIVAYCAGSVPSFPLDCSRLISALLCRFSRRFHLDRVRLLRVLYLPWRDILDVDGLFFWLSLDTVG